jgi:hypothetical protein
MPPHLLGGGECPDECVEHVDHSCAPAQGHAGPQRKGQHRVRDEDDEQEVPHQLYATLTAAEPDPFPEDACGSHRKHTRCTQTLQERMRNTQADRGCMKPHDEVATSYQTCMLAHGLRGR